MKQSVRDKGDLPKTQKPVRVVDENGPAARWYVMKLVSGLRLSAYAFRLYWHLVCISGTADADITVRALGHECNMGHGTAFNARRELSAAGLIDVNPSGICILNVELLEANRLASKNKRGDRGYIYLLKCAGFYKIGKTKRPRKRLDHFQTTYPHDLELVQLTRVEGMDALEQELHQRYQAKRHKGEWFALTGQDVAEIVELLKGASIDEV